MDGKYIILLFVFFATLVCKVLYEKNEEKIEKKDTNQDPNKSLVDKVVEATKKVLQLKNSTNTETPATSAQTGTPVAPAAPVANAPVAKKTNYFPWFVVAVMIGVGYAFVFVFPKNPDLLFYLVDTYQENFENVAPYLFAPVVGIAMFFLSKHYRKNFGAALMMTILVAGAIALWMHPDVLQGILEPFAMREPVGDLVSGKVWKFYATSFVLFLVAAWNGYAPHAVVIFLLVFIFLAR